MGKKRKWTKEDEKLLKKFFIEFLQQEREIYGPYEIDEETGEEIVIWYPEDFDEGGNLRESMKQWEWLLNGENDPNDTVLEKDYCSSK